jgi:hypothetical protein
VKKFSLSILGLITFLDLSLCGMGARQRSNSFSDFESIRSDKTGTYDNYMHEIFTDLFDQVSKKDFERFDVVIESALVDFILFIERNKLNCVSLQDVDVLIEELIKRALTILKKEEDINKDNRLNKFVENFTKKIERIFCVERAKKLKEIVSKFLKE